jgi:mono/diheme cytochrome c family protein
MMAGRFLLCGMAGVLFAGTGLFAADGNSTHATGVSSARQPLAITNCCGNSTNAVDNTTPTNATTTPTAVYVPDLSHANGPLPDGILAWDELLKSVDVPASQSQAHFVFNVTNISPDNVVVLGAHGSCSCTVTELPPLPWTIPPGGHGQVGAVVNLEGKSGVLFKAVTVSTDKGSKDLYLKITILPPVIPTLTDAERTNGVMVARADRQAIFKADCATCHAKPGEGKYGKALYDAVCAICHEANNRAEVVPDLRNLKTPTSDEFWRTWIAHGKAGSLMPAFSTAEGGPLNDMQIATVAAYLKMAIPSQPSPAN